MTTRWWTLVLAAAIALAATAQTVRSNPPSCYDEQGKPVDWYIAYKFPSIKNEGELVESGLAYAYITSNQTLPQDDSFAWTTPAPQDGTDTGTFAFLKAFMRLLLKYVGQPFRVSEVGGPGMARSPARRTSRQSSLKRYKPEVFDSDMKWTLSTIPISDPRSLILQTLQVAFDKNHANINSIFYNDQPPSEEDNDVKGRNFRRAHSKGALIINDNNGSGVWLTHSVPRFPLPHTDELKFEDNVGVNGQTFMCISFDLNRSGKSIVNHLVNMHPLIYDSYITEELYKILPELEDLNIDAKRGRRVRVSKEGQLAQVITTRAGQDLHLFSKSKDFEEDMYSQWIDHELKTTLFVESWRNGAGTPLDSSCPKNDFHVNNVKVLKYDDGKGVRFTWVYEKDHSKWAISDTKDVGVVCISDINRMESQFKRGGGAVCIRCPGCWNVFSKTILELEPCPYSPKSLVNNNNKTSSDFPAPDMDLIARLDKLVIR